MSRIPQSPAPSRNTSRTPLKKPSTSSLRVGTSTPVRRTSPTPTPTSRTQSTLRAQPSLKSLRPSTTTAPKSSSGRATKPLEDDAAHAPKTPALSLREQIALKRAETKKVMSSNAQKTDAFADFGGLEDALPTRPESPDENMVDLGRWSVKETIERARSTGAINLASRALPCLPSALFEIHLNVKPDPLKLVPVEPSITTITTDEPSASRRRGASDHGPSWYEAQDLEIIKAWSNEIVEIQPEISMFGSLKSIDLHSNKLKFLPDAFADLTALTFLDLSHNQLESLPVNLFAMPGLTNLNLSNNALTSMPFNAPFSSPDSNPLARTKDPRGDWYSQSITRATVPLPKLATLDVSNNHLTATSIDHEDRHLPQALTKIDLSGNPLGKSTSLFQALSQLGALAEIRCEKADIGDESFPTDLLPASSGPQKAFPSLTVLDLGETRASRPVLEAAFLPTVISQQLDFDVTDEAPKPGTLRVIIGKKVVKEAWEIEAERRMALRARVRPLPDTSLDNPLVTNPQKDDWDVAMQTEGAKRRVRAAAATSTSAAASTSTRPLSPSTPARARSTAAPQTKTAEKEAWEIEAEQGLLTAGGRRRARAAAAAALSVSTSDTPSVDPASATSHASSSPTLTISVLSQPQYYTSSTQTLTLPPSMPPSKSPHARSFSYAPSSIQTLKEKRSDLGLAVPTPTLPLVAILSQAFSHNLKVLILANRRMDSSFHLPSLEESSGPFLPCLEELSLEGCNLGSTVSVCRSSDASTGDIAGAKKSEPLFPLLAKLFPSLRTLDLSYNSLKNDALDKGSMSELILASDEENSLGPARKGLRHLRLRGNRITELDGFQAIAEMFKGNRNVPAWKLEELDLRDNEIGKLPPEIGLLPLDVFLVDGNVFRVPPRRVWEREGTKGLLSWLRGRIE